MNTYGDGRWLLKQVGIIDSNKIFVSKDKFYEVFLKLGGAAAHSHILSCNCDRVDQSTMQIWYTDSQFL